MWKWLEKLVGADDIAPLVLTKEVKPRRARTRLGRYKGDDKSTDDINEAWVGGKAPRKSKKVYKIKGRKYVLKKKLRTKK